MTLQMLSTKLKCPALRSNLIPRTRLLQRLQASEYRRLVLVTAPAGYGKTTLVLDWLQQRGEPIAWYAIDRTDNDPQQFMLYLVHALQQVDSGLGTSLMHGLQSPQPPDTFSAMTQLLNDSVVSGRSIVLVLDDLHLIEHEAIWQAVSLMIEQQPATLQLIVITREDPPLPLARLRGRANLLEVRTDDLQFSLDETSAFLRQVMALDLPDAGIKALQMRTEGWVAGLQLAAISLGSEPDPLRFIEAFSGSHRFILDYLTEEVLGQLPDDIRRFLLETSILEQFSAPLCDAVRGAANSEALLQRIEGLNLFLVQLDHEREWFRYHHLFADILRKLLRNADTTAPALLHLRASDWFEAKGMLNEAFQHASAAGNHARLALLIETHALDLIKRGYIRRAQGWIEMLPDEVRSANARINTDYAWCLFLGTDFALLTPLLDQIEQATTDPVILGEAATLRAFIAYDRPEEMELQASRALAIVPEENPMVRGLAHIALANVYQLRGEKQQAYDEFAKSIPQHWAAGNRVAAMTSVLDNVQISMALGNWKRSYDLIQQMIERARQQRALDEPALGLVYAGASIVMLHRFELEQAQKMLEHGLQMALSSGHRYEHSALLTKAQIAALQGEQALAHSIIEEGIIHLPSLPGIAAAYAKVRIADTWLLLNQVENARRWLGECAEVDGFYQLTLLRAESRQAMTLPNSASLQDCARRVAALAAGFDARGWQGYLIEALILLALVQNTLGAGAEALNTLRRALALAEPEREALAFGRERENLRPLLYQVPDHPYASSLLVLLDKAPPPKATTIHHPELPEALAQREMEVLRLMREGLTYEAIAQEMIISVNTVRYHVKGLYGKLGVSSRAEAIAKAHRLKFF